MDVRLDLAVLLGLFMETLFYGLFLTLYMTLILILLRQGQAGRARRRTLLPISTVMFILATAHLIIDAVRVFKGFLYEPEGPIAYFINISLPLFTAKSLLYVTQTLVGDAVMIWRCYAVFSNDFRVILLPAFAELGNICVSYVLCWEQSRASRGATVFVTASSWLLAFLALTLIINAFCTAAIAWRIYTSSRVAHGTSNLLPVLVATIESGALYTANVLVLLVTYLQKSNGQWPALDSMQPLIGVTFCLIFLQPHFQTERRPVSQAPGGASHSGSGPRYQWTAHGPRGESPYPMQSLAVQVTEETAVGYPAGKKAMEDDGSSV